MAEIIRDISEIPEWVLVQIKDWLEPWFQSVGSSGIRQVTSKNRTVRVLRGRGPVVDLAVALAESGWQFDLDNEGGWGLVVFNDHPEMPFIGEAGALFLDKTTEGLYLASIQPPSGPPQSVIGIEPDRITLTAAIGGSGSSLGLSNGITASAPIHVVELSAIGAYHRITDRLGGKIVEVVETGSVGPPAVGGGTVTVYDHAGAKSFEVRDDGTVHIRTGQTVIADL